MTKEERPRARVSVTIAPSVLFSIAETYQRRNEASPSRIVGALFGSSQATSTGTAIHAKQCFIVPHSEVADQISINSEYYKQRHELHKKCYGSQSNIVGWFSMTQDGALIVQKNTAFINDTFGREVSSSGHSPLSIHLNLHISSNGNIERHVTVTVSDASSKTNSPAEEVKIHFQSNEVFAGIITM